MKKCAEWVMGFLPMRRFKIKSEKIALNTRFGIRYNYDLSFKNINIFVGEKSLTFINNNEKSNEDVDFLTLSKIIRYYLKKNKINLVGSIYIIRENSNLEIEKKRIRKPQTEDGFIEELFANINISEFSSFLNSSEWNKGVFLGFELRANSKATFIFNKQEDLLNILRGFA